MNIKSFTLVILIVLALLLSSCQTAPAPQSDSDQSYQSLTGRIPVDDNVYTITGTVVGEIGSITEVHGSGYVGGTSYGVSGSYAMWQDGKGFIRLRVANVMPSMANFLHSDLAEIGTTIIIKTTDQKIMALLPGDEITLKCRVQYEAVAAIYDSEQFDTAKAKAVETWEIDYCRMLTPRIHSGE